MVFSAIWPYSYLSFYLARAFTHLLILFSLIAHQLLSYPFVDPLLSVGVYSLCGLILFFDGLFLFFYKEEQQKDLLLLLLLAEAIFLSALMAVLGFVGLFFILPLVFIQSLPLFLSGKTFSAISFLLYLAIFLPLSLFLGDVQSLNDRWFSSIYIGLTLFFIFGFGYLLNFFLQFTKKAQPAEGPKDTLGGMALSSGLSLALVRKLKPVVNSLLKYFPENVKANAPSHSVPSQIFPPQKGRQELNNMRKFLLDFIEYAEPETESLLEDKVDLNRLLQGLLDELNSHPHRPENLKQKINCPVDFKVKGSSEHLKKGFKHIIVNSFEALKNQNQAHIHIRGYWTKDGAVVEFLDNGHGIEPEDIKKLFDPLFSKRFGLRGLGLAYTQKILKAHKASLHIENLKKGLKVSVKFPLISGFYPTPAGKSRKKVTAA